MTTIVYRDGVLASDTGVFDRGCFVTETEEKIFEHEGSLFGVTGSFGGIAALKRWLKAGRRIHYKPDFKDDDLEIIEIDPEGNVFWMDDTFQPVAQQAEFHIAGAGYRIALGALEMGATATMAIDICIKRDCYTAGKVIFLNHRTA